MHSPIISSLSVFALGLEGVVSQLMLDRSHLVCIDSGEKFERTLLSIFLLLLINYLVLGFFFILGLDFCFFMMFDFMMFFFDLFAFYL